MKFGQEQGLQGAMLERTEQLRIHQELDLACFSRVGLSSWGGLALLTAQQWQRCHPLLAIFAFTNIILDSTYHILTIPPLL